MVDVGTINVELTAHVKVNAKTALWRKYLASLCFKFGAFILNVPVEIEASTK